MRVGLYDYNDHICSQNLGLYLGLIIIQFYVSVRTVLSYDMIFVDSNATISVLWIHISILLSVSVYCSNKW